MLFEESSILELKESYSASCLKTVSAFANERDGQGIFGVKDNGDVAGVDDAAALRLQVENAINDTFSPIPLFALKTEIVNDKPIVILNVKKGKALPYFYKGKAYRRSDTSSVAADVHQLRELVFLRSKCFLV